MRNTIFALLVCLGCASVATHSQALSVTYSYTGNTFTKVSGEPGVFSMEDRVTGSFTVLCEVADQAVGDCRNLSFANYYELGAVGMESIQFSAGPARFPEPGGQVEVLRFSFSTDSSGAIKDWDIDFGPLGQGLNIDTDNNGEGVDSAAIQGAFADVHGHPGNWVNDLPVTGSGFDISVDKAVDNQAPSGPQQTVEFTVDVSNAGPAVAKDVVVVDRLPSTLKIPDGMAAYTSVGNYDPESGKWTIGDIEAGLAPEKLSIPVVVVADPMPACIINSASVETPGDKNPGNNQSSIALRKPGVERCVDMSVERSGSRQENYPCSGDSELSYMLKVGNAGPDAARNVVLEVRETSRQMPGFRMIHSGCEGTRCFWERFEPGRETYVMTFTDRYNIDEHDEHTIEVTITSDTQDYAPGDNRLIAQQTIGPVTGSCGFPAPDLDFNLGAGAGSCFIATASYGTDLHPKVQVLREFRDQVLLKSGWGRALVDSYYKYSPDLACYIAERDGLRMITRALLAPIVFAISYPWSVLALCIFAFALLLATRSRRRHRGTSQS